MEAILITPNFEVNDLERVESFTARRGQEFRIVLSGVVEVDVFANNDPAISFITEGTGQNELTIRITANADGVTRLQVRNLADNLLKEWALQVYSDQAASLGLSAEVAQKG